MTTPRALAALLTLPLLAACGGTVDAPGEVVHGDLAPAGDDVAHRDLTPDECSAVAAGVEASPECDPCAGPYCLQPGGCVAICLEAEGRCSVVVACLGADGGCSLTRASCGR